MSQTIVVALGGNAILTDNPTAKSQIEALGRTSESLLKLVEAGYRLVITHGNGPQVGNLLLQQSQADSPSNPAMPLDTCVAMTQGSIGYWLQNQFNAALSKAGIDKQVVSIVTQIQVDENDPTFQSPSKPIGPFLSEEEANKQAQETGDQFMEDAGRGYRKVVASPKPLNIIEAPVVEALLDHQVIPVVAGGGGIAVVKDGENYRGVEAVIDKDFASSELAREIDADELIILTAVSQVKLNYQTPEETTLKTVTVSQMQEYIEQGHFAPGSMLPKVEAAIEFVKGNKGHKAIITSLDNLSHLNDENSITTIIED